MVYVGLNSLSFVVALAIFSVVNNGKFTSLAFSSYSISVTSAIHHVDIFHSHRHNLLVLSAQSSSATECHTVQGILCREVINELPVIGKIVVLEATADAQEELVDECLELEDENSGDGKKKRITEGDPYGCVYCGISKKEDH